MATATFKVQLKDTPRADGLYAVRIRITRNRRHAYYNTGLAVKKSEFNPAGSEKLQNWIRSHRQHRTYNDSLQDDIDDLRKLSLDHPEYSAQDIRTHFKTPEEQKPEKGLLAYWQVMIDRKRALGQEGTAESYETARSYLLAFTGPDPDERHILTRDFGMRYLAHLRTATKDKIAYKPSTCNEAMTKLNTVYAQAVLEGWVTHAGNPFADLQLTVEPKKRLRPTHEQVMAMLELEYAPGEVEYDARNCFLLQYFLHGARVSEALQLEWSEVSEKRVEYKPQKRGKRMKHVAMNPGLEWVLNHCDRSSRFVLPYLTEHDLTLPPRDYLKRIKASTDHVRYGLEKISKRLGLPFRLTSHMARHAFADKALAELDDMYLLQNMLGHSSIRTTENYVADLSVELLDQATHSVYGSVSLQGNNRKTLEQNPSDSTKAKRGRKRLERG